MTKCLTCQQVKAEHQQPLGLLKPLPLRLWKWQNIAMDFVVGLPKIKESHDAIWVIVDRLTKSAHFLPVSIKYFVDTPSKLYIREVVKLHGIPISIVSDRDACFTSKFWSSFQKSMGTRLDMSTPFHPQTDSQTEGVNQVMEDMLRACVLDFKGSWDEYLALIEFAYNNSYHSSIGMTPYEALYGRPCRSPVCWAEATCHIQMIRLCLFDFRLQGYMKLYAGGDCAMANSSISTSKTSPLRQPIKRKMCFSKHSPSNASV